MTALYDWEKWVSYARQIVLTCSSVELLLVLFHYLDNSSLFAQLLYFSLLAACVSVSAHNITLNIDGRDELRTLLTTDSDIHRARSAILSLTPLLTGGIVFFFHSHRTLFSIFGMGHVIGATIELGIFIFEMSDKGEKSAGKSPSSPSVKVNEHLEKNSPKSPVAAPPAE